MMTVDEAILQLRADPKNAQRIRDSYLGPDTLEAAQRFSASPEFAEVLRLAGGSVAGKRVLDLGAGVGIASYAFAKAGAERVYAAEPDLSDQVGRGAMQRCVAGLPVDVLDASAERLPLQDEFVDLVYVRQVLHHIRDLGTALAECARVLKPGGMFIATREHVSTGDDDLQAFLRAHPVHQLAGGENAYPLSAYLGAIKGAGLRITRVLGTYDSVINTFPEIASNQDAIRILREPLRRKFGLLGTAASYVPPIRRAVGRRLERNLPGRMYSFVAVKR